MVRGQMDIVLVLHFMSTVQYGRTFDFTYTPPVGGYVLNDESEWDATTWSDPDFPTKFDWDSIVGQLEPMWEYTVTQQLYDTYPDLVTMVSTLSDNIATLNAEMVIMNTTTLSGYATTGALSTLQSEVTADEAAAATLTTRVGTDETAISGKASAASVTTISTQQTADETTLAGKASASSVTTLSGTVTALQTEVTADEVTISGKASTSSVSALATELGVDEAAITALQTKVGGFRTLTTVTLPTGASGNNVIKPDGTFTMTFTSGTFLKAPLVFAMELSASGVLPMAVGVTSDSTTAISGTVDISRGTLLLTAGSWSASQTAVTFLVVEQP